MLPAGARLTGRRDFGDAVRSGVRGRHGAVVLHGSWGPPGSRRDDEVAPALVGFTVGRGVGGAVVRNRVRRRLRHLMRARLDRLPAGSRWVVRAEPSAAVAGFTQLGQDLDRLLSRLLPRLEGRVDPSREGR